MYCVYEIYLWLPITSESSNRPVAAFVLEEDADLYMEMMEEKHPGLMRVKAYNLYGYIEDGGPRND